MRCFSAFPNSPSFSIDVAEAFAATASAKTERRRLDISEAKPGAELLGILCHRTVKHFDRRRGFIAEVERLAVLLVILNGNLMPRDRVRSSIRRASRAGSYFGDEPFILSDLPSSLTA